MAFCLEAEICRITQQESHAPEITDAKEPGMDDADVGRQPGVKMLFALCLASAVEGPRAKGPWMALGGCAVRIHSGSKQLEYIIS